MAFQRPSTVLSEPGGTLSNANMQKGHEENKEQTKPGSFPHFLGLGSQPKPQFLHWLGGGGLVDPQGVHDMTPTPKQCTKGKIHDLKWPCTNALFDPSFVVVTPKKSPLEWMELKENMVIHTSSPRKKEAWNKLPGLYSPTAKIRLGLLVVTVTSVRVHPNVCVYI